MGKKPGEKGREWEKERRDKLNAGFHELCKLLPDHDPSITMSKMEILRKATEYIKHLQEKNEEIIKCGNASFLKSETERLKKKVAYLILKTTQLVDALRQAGVPIPSNNKKKNNQKAKAKDATNALNQQNNDPCFTNKQSVNGKPSRKKIKNGNEKKATLNKKPLTEVNPSAVGVNNASSAASISVFDNVNGSCNNSTSQTTVSINTLNNIDKCISDVVTQNNLAWNAVSSNNTGITINQGLVQQAAIVNKAGLSKKNQKLKLGKKELPKLGPGTLIFADGRIVSVPPVLPQIVMKPPPSVPPPAVILMPEIAIQKPLVRIATDTKREKFIIPKKREITMTTFVNKMPIPAVKTFRLESCSKEPRTKKKSKDQQKKGQSEASTTIANSSNSETTVDNTLLKRKVPEDPKVNCKNTKNNTKNDSSTCGEKESPSIENNQEKNDRSQIVKYTIDGLFSNQSEDLNADISGKNPSSNLISNNLELQTPVSGQNETVEKSPSEAQETPTPSKSVTTLLAEDVSVKNDTSQPVLPSKEKSNEEPTTSTTELPSSSNNSVTTNATSCDVSTTLTKSPTSLENNDKTIPAESLPTILKTLNNDVLEKSKNVDSSSKGSSKAETTEALCSKTSPIIEPPPISAVENLSESLHSGKQASNSFKPLVPTRDIMQPITSNFNLTQTSSLPNSGVDAVSNTTMKLGYDVSSSKNANFNSTSASVNVSTASSLSTLASTNTEVLANSSYTNSKSYPCSNSAPETILPTSANVNKDISPPLSSILNTPTTSMDKLSANLNPVKPVENPRQMVPTENEFLPPATSGFNVIQTYCTSAATSGNILKSSGVYAVSDIFTNTTESTTKTPNFQLGYMDPSTLSKTLANYTMSDVFSGSNTISQIPSSIGLCENNNSGKVAVPFKMAALSVGNASTLPKTFPTYSVTDAFVTNMHLNQKNTSNFNMSEADLCCMPSNMPKYTSSACCPNNTYSSTSTLAKTSPTFANNNLFPPPLNSSMYKTSTNYGGNELNDSIRSKPTTAFNMSEMFHQNTTFNNSQNCASSKVSNSFSVADVFTTNASTVSKTSHTFTMAEIYSNANPITTKNSLPFTVNDITSSSGNTSSTFTVGQTATATDRISKPCEQISTSLPSIVDHLPLYDAQHKLAPAPPVIPSSKNQYNTDKEKTYPVCSMSNSYRGDQCNDFLRTSRDLDRGFMPVIEDMRLNSDFSNDLFSTLQVPSGGHHSESISPTAAFLLAFPLVSTSKNTENMTENENHDNQTSTPTTILQIGNIDPPSTELFHSMDFGKNKDFEVQTDLDYKTKQKSKQRNNPPVSNQTYPCYPIFPNDYNHQCDVGWTKPAEKKKTDKSQKYQYDCYKQDKKKRKISVNWMTTSENDLYKESEFPTPAGGNFNMEMEPFPDLCTNKKGQSSYSWSPSKSLLPIDNPLMIPSTLPTLVGDLALGTTPSEPFKRCEKKDKQEEKKFSQPKSQSANFLSVSQLVDAKCKKQKSTTERPYNNKQRATSSTSSVNDNKKRQCMGGQSNQQREQSYQTSKRKEPNEPCMYPDNTVSHFNWDNKSRYKGGSYSAESLIHQDTCETGFNFNYQQNNFIQSSTEFGHDNGQSGCGQYQNFLNFPQGPFSSCVSEEYPAENFALSNQSNNRMAQPPSMGQPTLNATNEKQRNMSQPTRDPHLRVVTSSSGSYHQSGGNAATSFHHHYPHHPGQQQAAVQQHQLPPPPQHQHHQHHQHHLTAAGYPAAPSLQHNFSSVGSGPPPPPLAPPVSNYSVTTTSTLANFNLSTIFPEINDQRVGPASLLERNNLSNFSTNQSYRGHTTMH